MTPRTDLLQIANIEPTFLIKILNKTSAASLCRLRRSCKIISQFIEQKYSLLRKRIKVNEIEFLKNDEKDWRKKARITSRRYNKYGLSSSFREDDFCRLHAHRVDMTNLDKSAVDELRKVFAGRISCNEWIPSSNCEGFPIKIIEQDEEESELSHLTIYSSPDCSFSSSDRSYSQ